jgi:hypothetical protein
VNLEQIYVDSEEFSFEELLAKKRGLYGLRFEKPKSPVDNVFLPVMEKGSENVFRPILRSPVVKRSPLQQKPIVKTSSPLPSPTPFAEQQGNEDENIVYMPIRGIHHSYHMTNLEMRTRLLENRSRSVLLLRSTPRLLWTISSISSLNH